jgi:enoyl-CoA hydratase
MADEQPIVVECEGQIAWLRLNRPERLNAVSLELYRVLDTSLRSLARDRSVRAVILTGTGRGFCVGADLKAHTDRRLEAKERATYVRAAQRAAAALQALPRPVVAAVNGHAIGAGLELALSCDLIVIAQDAKLRFPEVALGTFVGGGVTYTLADRVGAARARELLLLGEFFTPEQALAMGLANRVVPTDRVMEEAKGLAAKLAQNAPVSLQLLKQALHRATLARSRGALTLEARALLKCFATRDWAEGVRAFAEKRPPQFVGE